MVWFLDNKLCFPESDDLSSFQAQLEWRVTCFVLSVNSISK